MVLKKMDPMKSYDQNKQKNEKKGDFLGYFLCKIGWILKVVAAPQKNLKTLENLFELFLGIDTAVCEIP